MTKQTASKQLSELDRLDGTLMQMVEDGVPLTKANYLARAYGSEGPPDPMTAEALELPPYFDEPEDDL